MEHLQEFGGSERYARQTAFLRLYRRHERSFYI